ncbi:hypothetical protein G6F46_002815 [Rhizopus delemar]|uniref:NOT2/NOT3/NOT5 C-terminal domain-containing protein n=2 Tax=Rhizopus TaxID=4842 RepID=A0A9P7C5Q3_RHIOR|nr:hypothetical protein G6F55_009770 [Rhizopus delemar]KAG1536934.1 hypothetical protein G6F51_010676 [Rhizopus arrhizus]KAG1491340.1 hypothetical protein G6F54_010090 [Rhizopus delemar]KAG1509420.1 hypothetical protein G6F52_011142 [Rhizopus delemar]KAG1600215.1 hypothetical protein G6F47_004812 [Rhizopus delemar]
MFRPNTTTTTTAAADLNEFPVLGTPPSINRTNRLTGYASTAGNGFQEVDDLHKLTFNNRNGFADQLSNRNLAAPRSFSMDEFPALRSAQTPFDNTLSRESGKPEQWLDYANLREQQQHQGGKLYPEKNELSESWMQARKQQEELPSSDGKVTDPYGLLGLLGVIRMTDPDRSMLALGSDLTTLGLDLNTADSIYSTFISPWSDTQTLPGLNIEPGYSLPACYRQVRATPPAHQRMRTFSDEILFYIFYCMPKDIAQEAAAQELYARHWRYHKELGLWLTKETDENGRPVQSFRRTSSNGLDRGVFVFFDPTSWQKVKREWTLSWDALEERNQPTHPSNSSNTNRVIM